MPSQEKVERVAALKHRIEGSSALLLAEYRGLTVSEIGELRAALREADASFAVIKNTLMARAAVDAGIQELEAYLSGPSAVAFVGSEGDPVAAAKKIKAASKQYPALVLKGGYMDGEVLSAEDALRLADLESREEMLSKIAGMLKSEMSRAAASFIAAQSKFLSLLEAYKEKVPGEAEAPAESTSGDDSPAEQPAADADADTASEPPAESSASEEPASEEPAAEEPAAEEAPAEASSSDEAAAEVAEAEETESAEAEASGDESEE